MKQNLVVIPTFNEIENIEDILRAVMQLDIPFDVLVVDDNSPDGTAEAVLRVAEEFTDRIYLKKRLKKNGLGTAYVAGFNWALKRNYEYIFEMDADFSHNPNDLPKLLQACKDGANVSIGSQHRALLYIFFIVIFVWVDIM